jgi:hypothetical protein
MTVRGTKRTCQGRLTMSALEGKTDEPRRDARKGLKLLADAGIKTVMLTGDNRRTANAIGQQLGVDVEAELLPEDKQRIVGEFQKPAGRSPRSATALTMRRRWRRPMSESPWVAVQMSHSRLPTRPYFTAA